MLTSLYFFHKKENETRGNDVLFDTVDDPTDVVATIEKFANINKDNAVSALDGFVNEKSDDWDLFFWLKSSLCALFLKSFVWNEDEEEMKVPTLSVLYLLCTSSWLSTHLSGKLMLINDCKTLHTNFDGINVNTWILTDGDAAHFLS